MYAIRCRFNRIESYAQAIKTWKAAVIFPKDCKLNNPLLRRGLVDKRKKHLTIERTEAEDIILRLYDHPVVTWHKDNSLTICGYQSRSTVVFANHCTPVGMYMSLCGTYFAATIDGRTYKILEQITFRERDNTWKADKITPWSVSVVNRERAKQALHETNYKEFRLWLVVYLQMASRSTQEIYGVRNIDVINLLRDRKWRELVTRYPLRASADQVLHEIRDAIYREYDCIEHKSVPFLG